VDTPPSVTVLLLFADETVAREAASGLEQWVESPVAVERRRTLEAALAALDDPSCRIDCVVTDDRLPGCDGAVAIERLRTRDASTPVVVYSSGDHGAERADAEANADGHGDRDGGSDGDGDGDGRPVDPGTAIAAGAAAYFARTETAAPRRVANAVDRAAAGRLARAGEGDGAVARDLNRATRELMRARTAGEVADVVADAACDVLGFPHNGVRLYDPDADVLRAAGTAAAVADQVGDRPAYDRRESPHWTAFESGEPVVVRDAASLEDAPDHYQPGSVLYLPLSDHGTLSVGSVEPGGFDDADVELAQVLAANASVALDLVDREAELRERTAQLARQNDRLEEFAGAVSHDLRGPLSAASGHLSLAMEDASPAVRDRLEHVERALRRMETLTDEVLTLAREGRTVDDPQPVAIGEVARAAWGTIADESAADVAFEVAAAPTVTGDAERLRTVMENLFRNALDHGEDVTRVEVGPLPAGTGREADGPDGDPGVGGRDARTPNAGRDDGVRGDGGSSGDDRAGVDAGAVGDAGGGPAGFYVADDGSGFDFEEPRRALERGVTTADRGTGYGLAIVDEIVDAHGWSLALCRSADGGARIEVRV
jgi:signal transduction histidine kinase/CheY-like chemotaxis protein